MKQLAQARQAMTQEQRYRMMMETPIPRLIPKLAVPTIISMLVTAIYNMADTFSSAASEPARRGRWGSSLP